MAIRDDYLTSDAAAEELGVTVRTLQRWAAERTGPARTRVGRKVLYRRAAVEEWLRRAEEMPVRDRAGA